MGAIVHDGSSGTKTITSRDAKVVEDTAADIQRGVGKAMKKLYFDFDKVFQASPHLFDPEFSSEDEKEMPVETAPTEEPPQADVVHESESEKTEMM